MYAGFVAFESAKSGKAHRAEKIRVYPCPSVVNLPERKRRCI